MNRANAASGVTAPLGLRPEPCGLGHSASVTFADPAASLLASSEMLLRAGRCESAAFARRMAADAAVTPDLYHDYARQMAERAERVGKGHRTYVDNPKLISTRTHRPPIARGHRQFILRQETWR
jgi:hypothetical protein